MASAFILLSIPCFLILCLFAFADKTRPIIAGMTGLALLSIGYYATAGRILEPLVCLLVAGIAGLRITRLIRARTK